MYLWDICFNSGIHDRLGTNWGKIYSLCLRREDTNYGIWNENHSWFHLSHPLLWNSSCFWGLFSSANTPHHPSLSSVYLSYIVKSLVWSSGPSSPFSFGEFLIASRMTHLTSKSSWFLICLQSSDLPLYTTSQIRPTGTRHNLSLAVISLPLHYST